MSSKSVASKSGKGNRNGSSRAATAGKASARRRSGKGAGAANGNGARASSSSTSTAHVQSARLVFDSIRRIVRVLRLSARHTEKEFGLSAAQLFVVQKLSE